MSTYHDLYFVHLQSLPKGATIPYRPGGGLRPSDSCSKSSSPEAAAVLPNNSLIMLGQQQQPQIVTTGGGQQINSPLGSPSSSAFTTRPGPPSSAPSIQSSTAVQTIFSGE